MSLTNISKFISMILRHKPEKIGISLDEHGWASVSELLEGISKKQYIDMAMFEKIVATDSKQRYSFNEDKTLIRANQGHSIPVSLAIPSMLPDILRHSQIGKHHLPLFCLISYLNLIQLREMNQKKNFVFIFVLRYNQK